MKKIFVLALLPFFLASCDKEEILPISDVPSEISTFLETHFPSNPIMQAVEDKDGFELTYDITLEGGFYLEFDRQKEVVEIEGTTKLPDSVISSKLLDYVVTKYSNNFIVGWELDDKNQQIELDNELDLEFSMNGDFLRIDN